MLRIVLLDMWATIAHATSHVWHLYLGWATDLHVAVWASMHETGHVLTSPFMMSAYWDMAKMLAVLTTLFLALMVHSKTRRATLAAIKVVNRLSPKWAGPIMVAAALFPGQADELIIVVILLWPILRNEYKRRVFTRSVRYAWNQGER